MKHPFVKIVSLFLSFAALISLVIPAFAEEVIEDDFTVEVIPNEEIEAMLPMYLREALNDDIVPYGTSKPSSSSVYDLSEGQYNFSVSTKLGTTIYSKYVFIGHGGKVKFHIYDSAQASGGYDVKIFKKGLFDTTVYTKKDCPHNDSVDFTVSIGDADAKIYFAIIPDGTTYIQSNSYIAKG